MSRDNNIQKTVEYLHNNAVCIKTKTFDVPKKAIVFLHGYGSWGEYFCSILGDFEKKLTDTVLFFPTAPLRLDQGGALHEKGSMWFPLLDELTYDSVRRGLEYICPIIKEYVINIANQHNIRVEDVSLIGFSQGAMIAFFMLYYLSLDKIVSYSGLFVPRAGELSPKTKVLIVHGDTDTSVPYACSVLAQEELAKSSIRAEVYTCPGLDHSISQEGIDVGIRFLKS